MKLNVIFLAFIATLFFSSCQKTPDEIAHKVIEKAESIEALSWTENFKYNLPYATDSIVQRQYEKVFKKDTSVQYFGGFLKHEAYNFPKEENQAPSSSRVFNGEYEIEIDYTEEVVTVSDFEKYEEFKSSYYQPVFLDGISGILKYTLRNDTIPIVLAGEENVGDDTCYKLEIVFEDAYVFNMSNKISVDYSKDGVTEFTIWVSKDTYMPSRFIYNSYTKGQEVTQGLYTETEYSNISILEKDTLKFEALADFPEGFEVSERIHRSYRPELNLPINVEAPYWKLPALKGDSVSLDQNKGKLLLIEFTSVGCGACIKVMPKVKNIYNKYHSRGFNVVAIEGLVNDKKILDRMVGPKHLPYPYLYESKQVSKEYKVKTYPSFFLVDQNGKVVYRALGAYSDFEETMSAEIEKYL